MRIKWTPNLTFINSLGALQWTGEAHVDSCASFKKTGVRGPAAAVLEEIVKNNPDVMPGTAYKSLMRTAEDNR